MEHVARNREIIVCIDLVGKHETKTPLGRRIHTCKDNIKMDIKRRQWNGVDWIHPAQGLPVAVIHLDSIQCSEFLNYLRNHQLLEEDWSMEVVAGAEFFLRI
jgi:hypothetical protein